VEQEKLEHVVYSTSPAVHQLLLHADRNAPRLVAVVVPQSAFVGAFCAERGISVEEAGRSTVHSHPAFAAEVLQSLVALGRRHGCAEHEIPYDVVIEAEAWSIPAGTLSAVGKPKRGPLYLRYKEKIDDIYARLEIEMEAADSGTHAGEGGATTADDALIASMSAPGLVSEEQLLRALTAARAALKLAAERPRVAQVLSYAFFKLYFRLPPC
jgi:hypothetical protein